MILRKIVLMFTVFVLISSCQDVDMYEKDKFGSLTLSFIQPSDDLINSLENNRTSSQLADVDQVRITLSGEAPTTVNIVNGTASYSRSGLPVGTISVRVDLLGGGINKYTQSKSVTIVANQNASASFNAFTVTNQTINVTSSFASTYDIGDEIAISWTNTHADQPVDIERWDFIGSTWVKTATLADDWVGNSGTWNTQAEPSGESVKVRIQSTISNSFADSGTFQLLGQEDSGFFIDYKYNGQNTMFHDVITLDDGNAVAVGRAGTPSDRHAILVKFDTSDGSVIATNALSQQSSFRHITKGHNNELLVTGYLIGDNTQVILGAFNQDLSTIAVVSPTNVSGTSKEGESVDIYTNNGVDYILVSGSFNESGFPQPAVHMFDTSYNFLKTWYYAEEGKFQNVKIINDSYIWLQGNIGLRGGQGRDDGRFGTDETTLAIWSNLTDAILTQERQLSNWPLISIDLEGTKPSFISTENVYTTSSNLVYTGGEMYRYWGSGGTTSNFEYRYLDFVENDTNGDFVFIGNDARCDANGNGVIDNNDGICGSLIIHSPGSAFPGEPTQVYAGNSRSGGLASYMGFKAIDILDDGYVMVGDEVIYKTVINYEHGAYIAVVDFDGEVKTVDKSSIKINTAINYSSSAQSINAIYPDKEINKIN
tara:strand:+ start:80 stop:2038 length:1959 start_codon:yes stop_codon:yes gene_type:complete